MTYPKINYIGNKEKIADWISGLIPDDAHSLLDAFSGGCSIAYKAKQMGMQVFANDIMKINYHIGKALIENQSETLTADDVDIIFEGISCDDAPRHGFMTDNFANQFYFKNECHELDIIRGNIDRLPTDFKRSLALILMRRAMIRKMPYSRFSIKWDKIKQLRDEEFSYLHYGRRRAYHNLPFRTHFEENLAQYNNAVFDNGKENKVFNTDVFEVIKSVKADVIYMDPPYAGTMNDYFAFYGLLDSYVSGIPATPFENNFTDKKTIAALFDQLFSSLGNFRYWMLSYNSRSKPSKDEILEIIGRYANEIIVHEMPYAYRLTGKEKKQKDIEYIFIASNKP